MLGLDGSARVPSLPLPVRPGSVSLLAVLMNAGLFKLLDFDTKASFYAACKEARDLVHDTQEELLIEQNGSEPCAPAKEVAAYCRKLKNLRLFNVHINIDSPGTPLEHRHLACEYVAQVTCHAQEALAGVTVCTVYTEMKLPTATLFSLLYAMPGLQELRVESFGCCPFEDVTCFSVLARSRCLTALLLQVDNEMLETVLEQSANDFITAICALKQLRTLSLPSREPDLLAKLARELPQLETLGFFGIQLPEVYHFLLPDIAFPNVHTLTGSGIELWESEGRRWDSSERHCRWTLTAPAFRDFDMFPKLRTLRGFLLDCSSLRDCSASHLATLQAMTTKLAGCAKEWSLAFSLPHDADDWPHLQHLQPGLLQHVVNLRVDCVGAADTAVGRMAGPLAALAGAAPRTTRLHCAVSNANHLLSLTTLLRSLPRLTHVHACVVGHGSNPANVHTALIDDIGLALFAFASSCQRPITVSAHGLSYTTIDKYNKYLAMMGVTARFA